MKKKLSLILGIILICIAVIFIRHTINTAKETKEHMINLSQELMNSISSKNYESIQKYVKKPDGTQLFYREVTYFLLNTGFYRALLVPSDAQFFTHVADVNMLNPQRGTIKLTFRTLNGDSISNVLEYVNTGDTGYFITNEISPCEKEKVRYPFATDTPEDATFPIKFSAEDHSPGDVLIFSMVKDENGEFAYEIIAESEDDLKLWLIDQLYQWADYYKEQDEEYSMTWDSSYQVFTINCSRYSDTTTTVMRIAMYTILLQAMEGNADWHITINFYDYSTGELLQTQVIR